MCTLVVYLKVRKLDLRTLQYRRPQVQRLSFLGAVVNDESLDMTLNTSTPATQQALESQVSGGEETSISRKRSLERASSINITSALAQPKKSIDDMRVRVKDRRRQFAEDNPRTLEVFRQSLWYLGVFYITHVWSTSNRIVQQTRNGQTVFGLILVHSWFDPLQGFLNFMVYQRPRFNKYRKDSPNLNVLQCLRLSLRWTFLPELIVDGNLNQRDEVPREIDNPVGTLPKIPETRKEPSGEEASSMVLGGGPDISSTAFCLEE